MSQLLEIATELSAICQTFASTEVKFVPDYQLGETDYESKIYIVPVNVKRGIETRADTEVVYTYEIGLLRWIFGDADIEGNVRKLESLAEALLGEELSKSYVSNVETKLLYSVEAVAKRKQYIGVLSVDVRDLT